MRKGVADLHRRAQVSQKTNEHYLDALAQLDTFQYPEDPNRWQQLAGLLRRVGRHDEARQAVNVVRGLHSN